jgi:hypothetical protein
VNSRWVHADLLDSHCDLEPAPPAEEQGQSHSREEFKEATMAESKGKVRIELTPEQQAKVRKAIGKDAEAVELSVEELEERIAPLYRQPRRHIKPL